MSENIKLRLRRRAPKFEPRGMNKSNSGREGFTNLSDKGATCEGESSGKKVENKVLVQRSAYELG